MRFAWLLVLLAARTMAQTTSTIAATTVPTAPVAIDRESLLSIYRGELGDKFDPSRVNTLLRAQSLLEDYFDRPAERKQILTAIQETGVDVNTLGRLARVRMHWPELKGGVYYINERVGPHAVKYFLGLPANYDRMRPWPLVIKLPTADAFAGRKPGPTGDEVAGIYHAWINEALSHHPDAIILMPLLNLDEFYGPSYAGMNTVIQPLLHVGERVNVDPSRVYLMGHSMAAHAVWNLALHFPTYFAAVAPLAGSASADFQRLRIICLRNVLPVVWHDTDDPLIKVEASRGITRALKMQKCEVDYEETKGVGHTPTPEIVERIYAKMRTRARDLYPKRVSIQSNRPDTIFNRNDWLQIYQPVSTGDEKRSIFSKGRGFMITYANTFRADATIVAPNRIEVQTDNVAQLRIYVNDQMIDLSKPVTVVVNRRVRFEGLLKPSIDEMLKDQLFLGRGWRYYSGVIDLDLTTSSVGTTRAAPAAKPQ